MVTNFAAFRHSSCGVHTGAGSEMGSSIPFIDHVADQTRFEESKCAGSFIGAGLAAALLLLAAGSSGFERSTFGGFSFGGRASLSPFGIAVAARREVGGSPHTEGTVVYVVFTARYVEQY